MSKNFILISSDFDYKNYLKEFKLNDLLGEDFHQMIFLQKMFYLNI